MEKEKVYFDKWLQNIITKNGITGIFEKDVLKSFKENVSEISIDEIPTNIIEFRQLIEKYCFKNSISFKIEEKHLPTELIDKCWVKFTAYYFFV